MTNIIKQNGEAWFLIKSEDVALEPMLLDVCTNISDVPLFFETLQPEDDYFNGLKKKRKKRRKFLDLYRLWKTEK